MKTETLTQRMVDGLMASVGTISAMVSGLHDVDLELGRVVSEDTKNTHFMWTKDGRRITVTACSDGGLVVRKSKEVDPEWPKRDTAHHVYYEGMLNER